MHRKRQILPMKTPLAVSCICCV